MRCAALSIFYRPNVIIASLRALHASAAQMSWRWQGQSGNRLFCENRACNSGGAMPCVACGVSSSISGRQRKPLVVYSMKHRQTGSRGYRASCGSRARRMRRRRPALVAGALRIVGLSWYVLARIGIFNEIVAWWPCGEFHRRNERHRAGGSTGGCNSRYQHASRQLSALKRGEICENVWRRHLACI